MGSSVDEGDELLNVETGRATALTPRRLVSPSDFESDRASAASTGEMSAVIMLALL
jgi:hypothetical protein